MAKATKKTIKDSPPFEGGADVMTIEAEEIPMEDKIGKTINQELEKANVTEKVIANLREKYLPLKLKGLDDKEGYMEIVEGRKDCKQWRILTGKICKRGREAAVMEQKLWISKEKDVSDRIAEVESYLEKQEDAYEAEQNRLKAEKKAQQDRNFAARLVELTAMGVAFNGAEFVSGEVVYDASMIRETDEEAYRGMIFPKFICFPSP